MKYTIRLIHHLELLLFDSYLSILCFSVVLQCKICISMLCCHWDLYAIGTFNASMGILK